MLSKREAYKKYPPQMWNTKSGLFPPKELSLLLYLVDKILIGR